MISVTIDMSFLNKNIFYFLFLMSRNKNNIFNK